MSIIMTGLKREFPQVLKGAATATSSNAARTGTVGRKKKPITMPKMPWDDKPNNSNEDKSLLTPANKLL